jgi:hypothetical protein
MEFRKLFLFAPTYRGPDRELDGSIWGATNGREVTRGVKKFTGLIISVSVCGIKILVKQRYPGYLLLVWVSLLGI